MRGVDFNIKESVLSDSYEVECEVRELAQARVNYQPQRVELPKLTITVRGDELFLSWSCLPDRFVNIRDELENGAKDKVKSYLSSR